MSGLALVTGISGFVGAVVGRRLRASGWRVVGLSRSAPREGACDLSIGHDLATGPPALADSFDAVIHCAALASPWARPEAYEAANIAGLENMLVFMRGQPRARFVFVSSSAVHYAYVDQEDLTEETPFPGPPVNLYAETKRRGEAMVRASGLDWIIVRPRAVFGPGDTVVFPHILDAARRGVLPVLTRVDGVRPRADLLYIDTLAAWIERALAAAGGRTYLLANGEPVETAAMLADVFHRLGLPQPRRRISVPVAMTVAGAMEAASRRLFGWREPAVTRFGVASLAYTKTIDIARARAELGPPEIGLDEGMDRFIHWQRQALA